VAGAISAQPLAYRHVRIADCYPETTLSATVCLSILLVVVVVAVVVAVAVLAFLVPIAGGEAMLPSIVLCVVVV